MSGEERITALITGAGSELAFSIFKALGLSSVPMRLVACDIGSNALGLYWADKSYLVPPVRQNPERYLRAVEEIVRREEVKVIFPTPDHELEFLPSHRDKFYRECRCWIMVNPPQEMARFNDKWSAYQWYVEQGLPTPLTVRGDNSEEVECFLSSVSFPIVLKPRRGGGSRSVFFVQNFSELQKYLPVVPHPLLQEFMAPGSEEYTAGTFRTRNGRIDVIILRRELKFGMTYKAEVVFDKELEEFCRYVIEHTNLEGPNNIQFRRTDNGPKILEINPRFSGTAGIRAHFGFNEPEMVIREFVLNQDFPPPLIKYGKVLRYMHEEYVQSGMVNQFVDLRE